MTASRLPVALRAYTEPVRSANVPRPPASEKWPKYVLLFDTETTTDATQRFLFGWYRFCEWEGLDLRVLEEGIIHADEVGERDPAGYREVLAYARKHPAEARDPLIQIRSRSEFVEETFMNAAYRLGAMIVGFNLPLDLSRIAAQAGRMRRRGRSGFSLVMSVYQDETGCWQENRYRPRVTVEHVNAKRAWPLLLPTDRRCHHCGSAPHARTT